MVPEGIVRPEGKVRKAVSHVALMLRAILALDLPGKADTGHSIL